MNTTERLWPKFQLVRTFGEHRRTEVNVEAWTLNPLVLGSNPRGRTPGCGTSAGARHSDFADGRISLPYFAATDATPPGRVVDRTSALPPDERPELFSQRPMRVTPSR